MIYSPLVSSAPLGLKESPLFLQNHLSSQTSHPRDVQVTFEGGFWGAGAAELGSAGLPGPDAGGEGRRH